MSMKEEGGFAGWQERSGILLGEAGLEKLRGAFVAVIGLGGVGAYAAEMLVRAGVGRLLLLDSDRVSVSNKNRQLLALDSTVGLKKCDVMAARAHDINPQVELILVDDYILGEICDSSKSGQDGKTVAQILDPYKASLDYVVDAIDTLSPKIALIKYCMDNSLPLVSSMGSGAKMDATAVRVTDISKSYNCPLAYILRKKLRKLGVSKGFKAVFSEELPDRNAIVQAEERNKKSQVGTISYLPAVFGCVCAQTCIKGILD
ncbi:MAG: tRNA threonylcarbamoyladenosine dehydratase [Bacteroidales bacterium]|nr:tRNA threonylcarbamoyladenosine dehydratase [Bacteroidales bacterium]